MNRCEFCRDFVTEGGEAHLMCAVDAAHHNQQSSDEWKRRAEAAIQCSDQWVADRRQAIQERAALAVQNDALREALKRADEQGLAHECHYEGYIEGCQECNDNTEAVVKSALALTLPRAAEIAMAMREVCEAIKRAAKENKFLLSRDERAALSRLLEVERGSAEPGSAEPECTCYDFDRREMHQPGCPFNDARK